MGRRGREAGFPSRESVPVLVGLMDGAVCCRDVPLFRKSYYFAAAIKCALFLAYSGDIKILVKSMVEGDACG